MSEVKPYYLIGATRLQALQNHIEKILQPLGERWWRENVSFKMAHIDSYRPSEYSQKANFFIHDEERWLALFGSDDVWRQLAGQWLGCSVVVFTDLTQRLMLEFVGDLFNALTQKNNAPSVSRHAVVEHFVPQLARPGAGVISFAIEVGAARIEMLAPAELWPLLAKPQQQEYRGKLTQCGAALGATRVVIDATLSAVQLPLHEVINLAPGDFLNLGHDLSGTVQLRGRDIKLNLPATLGKQGDNKAVAINGTAAVSNFAERA